MKAFLAAVLGGALCAPLPAAAGELLLGVVRDPAGAPVAGAAVTAFDAARGVLGRDHTAVDGTFAIDVVDPAALIEVECAYCTATRVALHPGEATIVVVRRYDALRMRGPSPSDAAVLPERSAAGLAALVPFAVQNGATVSDRGLGRGRGAVALNGIGFYRATDGADVLDAFPARAVAAIDTAPATDAPLAGSYAAGGSFGVRPFSADADGARVDAGDAFDVTLRGDASAAHAVVARSADADGPRALGAASFAAPFAGGRLGFDVLDLARSGTAGAGAAAHYATASRRFETLASAAASESDATSSVGLDVRVRDRGPLGVEIGARVRRADGVLPDGYGGSQYEGALFADAARATPRARTWAVLALERASDELGGAAAGGTALAFSFTHDRQVGERWTLHAATATNARVPALAEVDAIAPAQAALERSTLYEASLEYADLRRFHARALAYTERVTGSAVARTGGAGIDAGWQIAPQLALRTWLLAAEARTAPAIPYAVATAAPLLATPLHRRLVWLTYGTALRFDVLLQGGSPAADVRVPFGRSAFVAGTANERGKRVTTVGLALR